MNLPNNLKTSEEKDSFLKTRTDTLGLSAEILNLLERNRMTTIRSIINKNEKELYELKFNERYLDAIQNSFFNLSLSLNFQTSKINEYNKANGIESPGEDFGRVSISESNNIDDSFSKYFTADISTVRGLNEKKELLKMRDLIVYILKRYSGLSYPAIAELLGNSRHTITTISYTYRKVSKNIGLYKNFRQKYRDLIEKAIKIKEESARIEQALVSRIFSGYKKEKEDNEKISRAKEVPERNLKILELYKDGLTLEKIGEEYSISRERIRQIIVSTIQKQVSNESMLNDEYADFWARFREMQSTRSVLIEGSKPGKLKKEKTERLFKWSRSFESCKSCGTMIIPHFQNGLCEECGNKSIAGDAREAMIKDHNDKCDVCSISRSKAIEYYKRDFYLSRKTKNVLCRKCFLESTGGKLGVSKKNKWKMFYD